MEFSKCLKAKGVLMKVKCVRDEQIERERGRERERERERERCVQYLKNKRPLM